MYAAGKGHTETADLLVRSNADVNVKDNVRINTIYKYVYYIYVLRSYIYIYIYVLRSYTP